MCNEWIMCDTGVYPVPDEGSREIEVLTLHRYGDMLLLCYNLPHECEGKGYPASWTNDNFESWHFDLDEVVCWQPLPALPQGWER